ncbi:MAG: phosphoglucosamine mutase [bacterium]
MMRQYFETDGIRGRVGEAPVTADFMLQLGNALGRAIDSRPATVVIGKDTRISGYMFESALEAGLSAAGVNILLLGPMPTPAISYLTRTLGADAGIVISASHNPYYDNGIKFFDAKGEKLSDQVEAKIESLLEQPFETLSADKLGKAFRIDDATGRYVEFCKSRVPDALRLDGMKIVLDCAHGATYQAGPLVFKELGAQVKALHVSPDGLNINQQCGSTSPKTLQAEVKNSQADLGLGFDGDGDRLVLVDENGELLNGDLILYILAKYRQQTGQLAGGVVGTVMTNLGLEQKFKQMNIPFQRAAVGDRYVHQKLKSLDWSLGGEASGHILVLDRVKTGDGIATALLVLEAIQGLGQSLKSLREEVEIFPQITENVRVKAKSDPLKNTVLKQKFTQLCEQMGDKGRMILRASGTEPVIRVTVEAEQLAMADQAVKEMSGLVRKQL